MIAPSREAWAAERLAELVHLSWGPRVRCTFRTGASSSAGALGTASIPLGPAGSLDLDSETVRFSSDTLRRLSALALGAPLEPSSSREAVAVHDRAALYEVVVAVVDLHELLLRLAIWLRGDLVLQSARFAVLGRSGPDVEPLACDRFEPGTGPGSRVRTIAAGASSAQRAVLRVVGADDVAVGYLVAETDESSSAAVSRLLDELHDLMGNQIAACMESDRLAASAAQDLVDDVLSDRPVARLVRRAALLGLDLDASVDVVALRPVDHDLAAEAVATLVRERLRSLRIPSIAGTTGEGGVLVLLPAGQDPEAVRALAPSPQPSVSIGLAPGPVAPAGLCDAARQAEWAAELGRSADPPHDVVRFAELGLYGLIDQREWALRLSEFARRRLAPLLDERIAKDGTLLATLAEVLRNAKLAGAASALFVHHSTLRYRIGRIEDLLGVSLSDPDDRFDLELALRILEAGERLLPKA